MTKGKSTNMGTFIDRLKAERDELRDRALKLSDFIETNAAFKTLEPVHQRLLKEQIVHMVEYLKVLDTRYHLLTADTETN